MTASAQFPAAWTTCCCERCRWDPRREHASPHKPLNSKRMTKQQLIEKVAAKTELKKSEVEVAVDSVLAMIAEALQANERVDLRGFGSFFGEREEGAPRPQPSHWGVHHHRRETGCGLQARQ